MKRDYLSVSALKAFAKSPNHYIQYVTQPKPQSKAMAFGSGMHCLLLQPDIFNREFAVLPKIDRRTKAGKDAYTQFEGANKGKQIIDLADYERMVCIRNEVEQNGLANTLLRQAQAFEQKKEVVISGYPFLGIADIVGPNYVADLKTAKDASPSEFTRSAYNFGYHLQAAAYKEIWGVDNFYWIAVETEAPWNITVFEQSAEATERSTERLHELIEQFKKWDGKPAGYADEVVTMELPRWA